ncbi:hypothetical protein EDD21DRAFT_381619 [Dissophora ornata]|nr:hypothetical protein EDD21DRAFT_381619 [Dissophora ornata]
MSNHTGEDDDDDFAAPLAPRNSRPAFSLRRPTYASSSQANRLEQKIPPQSQSLELTIHEPEEEEEEERDEIAECLICGKVLAHLDQARVEYHINNCIDEQKQKLDKEDEIYQAQTRTQAHTQTLTALHSWDSTVASASSTQGMFAGAQVDYLTMVRRCPICKLSWPPVNIKDKTKVKVATVKAGTNSSSSSVSATPPRKARHKLEHMKRCAKENKRTVQSLVYQIRLLKEKYERSIVLGTPMDASDPIESSQETYERVEGQEVDDDIELLDSMANDSDKVVPLLNSRKTLRGNNTALKQVVSLAETADVDFESDAIITTVHAPTPSRSSKLTRLQQLEQDQHDEGLQLALAISMSESESFAGSRPDSPFESSITTATTTAWSMAPLDKAASSSRKGAKRRKKTERERNETAVLPYADVQQLIQDNVHALLFPETDDTPSRASYHFDQEDDNRHEVMEYREIKTPPWGPSRFAGVTKEELENRLSQSSEPGAEASPQRSLWKLSHLKDTRDVESLDLDAPEPDDVALDNDEVGEKTDEDERRRRRRRLTFDNEQYVSRFMKRYIASDDGDEYNQESGASTPTEKSSGLAADGGISLGSESGLKHLQHDPDNKFSSPFWSDSKARRISFEVQKEVSQEALKNGLRNEIVGHLEVMVKQIQEAKLDAYKKILESMKRHPIAAGMRASEQLDLLVIEDESELGSSDEAVQYFDDYQEPPSPLLRYSKIAESVRLVSPITNGLYSPQNDAGFPSLPQLDNQLDHPDDKEEPILLDSDRSFQEESLYQQDEEDFDSQISGLMIYSPPASTYQEEGLDSPTTISIADSSCIDLGLIPSPEVSFRSDDTPISNRRISSSSSDLPSPLDFFKLGYHDAASLSVPSLTAPAEDTDLQLLMSQTDQDDRSGDGEVSPTWQESSWIGVTTPKRNNRVRGKDILKDYGDEALMAPPSRPRSAFKTRTGLPVPSHSSSSSSQQPLRKNVLHGLPLKTAVVAPPLVTAVVPGNGVAGESDEDRDFEEELQLPQRSTLPISQPTSDRTTDVQGLRTPSRSLNQRLASSHADLAAVPMRIDPQSIIRSNGVGLGAGVAASKTPSKRKKPKSRIMIRAEAMAAESARAVAHIRSQPGMPDYYNMTMARLRLAATTFGLKSGTKKMLADQLTTIWERLNPDHGQGGDEGGNQDRDQNQDRDRDDVEVEETRGRVDDDGDDDDIGTRRRLYSPYSPTMDDSGGNYSQQGASIDMDDPLDLDLDSSHGNRGSVASRGRKQHFGSPVISETEMKNRLEANDSDGGEVSDDNDLVSDDRNDLSSQLEMEDDSPSLEQGSVATTPTMERQLFDFLSTNAHFRKQYLTYKPLDLEQLWEECQSAKIVCTRQQVRQFLDRQGIVCIVPAHSTLGSWRKTRAKKQKHSHR